MRNVLILCGTGRLSSELTSLCVSYGDNVTIVVRDKQKIYTDTTYVRKLVFDRMNEKQTKQNLGGKKFDVVFDCSASVPQSVDWVLSCIETKRYIFLSSFETYAHYHCGVNVCEDDLPVINKAYESEIKVGESAWFARGKYNAELLIANKYPQIAYAIVRIPFVMSRVDDYDDPLASRLLKYVSAIKQDKPIIGKSFDRNFNFVESADAARFLFYLSEIRYKGVVNFASQGHVTMQKIITYIEDKLGKKALYEVSGQTFPFTMHAELTMNLSRCAALMYTPANIDSWLYNKLDNYIDYCMDKDDIQYIEKNKIQNWLVTGGSTGLGRALVLRLLQLGYNVATTSRDVSKLNDLPNEVIKIGLDVRKFDSCKNAVNEAISKLGKIDVLVNNAGLSHTSSFEETPNDIGDAIIDTNCWGIFNMMKVIIPYMRMNRNGTVINISSASGFRPRNFGSYYVASKFAVESITKSMKFECQKFMRVMSVEFGGLNSGLMQRQTVIHSQIEEYKKLPPLYPYKKEYRDKIDKAIDAVINVTNHKELPRDLILGWDAYQQFPQAMQVFEDETEKYKVISLSTDEAKRDSVNICSVTLPRNNDLKIQNWLITGGSGGFGKVLALRLNSLGYTVAVTSRDMSRLETLPKEIFRVESSLENGEACENVILKATEMMGSVDVLVNNATSNCWCSFEECQLDIMQKVFDVNFTIPKNMIKAILPYMRKNKNGTIINITSIAGIQPRARVSTYSAAKAALEGLTRTLKSECQRFLRIMAVEPVYMQTGIMAHNPVIDTEISDYRNLGRYTHEVEGIPNRKDIAAQQIINVVNQEVLPQSLLIGTEGYLIAKNEIERTMKEYEKYKDITLSICEKI